MPASCFTEGGLESNYLRLKRSTAAKIDFEKEDFEHRNSLSQDD